MDNPKVHFDDATLLLSLQYFIVNSQSSQRQQERLQFLSFRDMLTGLYNRNKYMKVLETFEKYPVCDTGVAYIDLNGLKQINDNLGHEAGDRLLCDAAKEILRTFPENSYRIGGDEFVIILPESGKAEFEEQMEQVKAASGQVAVLKSANMSLGINLLMQLLAQAATILAPAGFDMEIVEKHHNQKLDAPSGTALALADSMNDALGHVYEYKYDRSSERKKRDPHEIGISAVRGGSIVGEHEVIFAGLDEVIEFKHTAYSRSVFGKGAVEAAKFLAGKEAGFYDMQDVIRATMEQAD